MWPGVRDSKVTMSALEVFDAHAAGYDAVAESDLGVALRRRVHEVLEPFVGPGTRVIDLGCGTGIDAEHLGSLGAEVRASDGSAEMVEIASRRCAAHPAVTVAQADAAEFDPGDSWADLVLANFGVPNCMGDPAVFGARLAQALRPGGRAIMVTMPRWCPTELAMGVARRDRDLLRRRSPDSRTDRSYQGLDIRYHSASGLAKAFAPHLRLVNAEGLGVVLPPFEQRGWVEDRPGLLSALDRIDRAIAPIAARCGVGDHQIAVFERPANVD